jgi:hypothetical protein
MRPIRRAARIAIVLALPAAFVAPVRAQDAPAQEVSRYGDTYTKEELAALDRALHAGNLTREDLTFRKDMTKGIGCLPVVREMLRDPLRIAPVMDQIAREASGGFVGQLRASAYLYSEDAARPLWIHARPAVQEPPAAPATPGDALDILARRLQPQPGMEAEDVAAQSLRRRLPDEMAMREVFASPYEKSVDEAIEAYLKAKPASWVHDEAARLDVRGLADLWILTLHTILEGAPTWPKEAFPADAPLVKETPFGRIALGTFGDDVYTGDYAAIVDPGGNDRYVNGHFAASLGVPNRRVGLLIDLGGDDVYDCRDTDATLGAAFFGVALLADLGQGNDRYLAGHGSLGAAVAGVAVLYDDGGSDVYEGKSYTQGAAGFGIGILFDDAVQAPPALKSDEETKDPVAIAAFDNDRLRAWVCAQGLARPRGIALCVNTRGNEIYEAGGVYLHAPLFSDRYQSFSQGFAIGAREHDYAGGIAMLIDREGNDRYLGDIYDQGVGYWYSAGFLWDGGGHDHYEMTQYGQGSGIHLAVGGLVDVAGSDAYVMHSGLGQGGSHDYAGSILHDRGGNDRYHGNTSCNGCGLTNSVGIHVDRAGDDTYAARRDGGWNAGRPARGYGSVGLFVDLAGKDDYLQSGSDGGTWRSPDVGVGVDEADPAVATPGGTSEPNQITGKADVPPVCRHEGPLDPKVFDELWAIACRWEVGDNRYIVPEARKRLVAFGKDVIPYLDGKMEKDDSGLELRAYVDVLGGLAKEGASAEVTEMLRTNLASTVERRQRVALYLVGELKVKDLEQPVVAFLGHADENLSRRAVGVLQALGSHAGDEVLKGWLARTDDERAVLTAVGALLTVEADVYREVRPLFDHPLVSVRVRLATALAEHPAVYGAALLSDFAASKDLPARGVRARIDALTRAPVLPDAAAVTAATALLDHDDWAMRGDAARLIRHWAAQKDADAAVLAPAIAALDRRLTTEKEPFVRGAGAAAK